MDIIPIGTIVAYSGPLNETDKANLKSLGWLPCDGSLLKKKDYVDLASAISLNYGGTGSLKGNFNVPDFRGRFLRGVPHGSQNDPDISIRTTSNAGGNTGNRVGSVQSFATGKPEKPFDTNGGGYHIHNVPHAPVSKGQPHASLITSFDGKHTHSLKSIPVRSSSYRVAGDKLANWNEGSGKTDVAGNHKHELTGGGDKETRPVNVYNYFIIKFAQL